MVISHLSILLKKVFVFDLVWVLIHNKINKLLNYYVPKRTEYFLLGKDGVTIALIFACPKITELEKS